MYLYNHQGVMIWLTIATPSFKMGAAVHGDLSLVVLSKYMISSSGVKTLVELVEPGNGSAPQHSFVGGNVWSSLVIPL